ncbi:type III secretion system translocon subunit SctE [Sinorhizobium meliloti]|uniref:type III secretion system translocon subunit SctE n=1 Tax=Rhizobium meliloti TaxID=382 RepID=UPI000EFC67D5|nr:type III secretion system translocon subunit SctE [Sinorhizobium meliloti]RMC62478.1 hypothetical protein EBB04_32895 [Sinorhizobium meliloti]
MHNVSKMKAVGRTLLEAGMLTKIDASTSNSSTGFSKSGAELALPPVSGGSPASDAVPQLPPPPAFNAMELAAKFLSLTTKMADNDVAAGMKDVRHRSELQKQQNDRIARNISAAAEKLRQAKKTSGLMRIFGWIAAALTVVAAVATGGVLAFTAAAVSVAMVAATEAGVIDKMTRAIAKSLMENQGVAQNQAKWWATFITVAVVLACSLATLGAGAGSGGWNAVTSIATKITGQSDKVAKIVMVSQRVATAARAGEGIASAAGASAGIASGVQQKQAVDAKAETLDIRKFLAKLAQLQEDEIARIQELSLGMKTMTQRVVDAMEEQSRSASIVIRHIA